jgi:ribose/xylose/arabinose/galactoside ABC-type transport system permease subunit
MLLANNSWPEWASYGAGLLAAIAVGLVNSFTTVKIGMPSFFGTLGTSFAVGGLVVWLLKGQFIYMGGQLPFLDKFW